MKFLPSYVAMPAIAAVLTLAAIPRVRAADDPVLPPQLTKPQRENLLRFLKQHEKPDGFIPRGARVVGSQPPNADAGNAKAPAKPVKQYMVQITPHRPVPGEEAVTRVDVYYYRPNPDKGKPGITVKHTVDVTTGKQVGDTEVLTNHHTPISRDELAEAVALAREKSPAVTALYEGRDEKAVQWEYLQLMINRKHGENEPGDRVVRLVFSAAAKEQVEPAHVAVLVNLTKGVVAKE